MNRVLNYLANRLAGEEGFEPSLNTAAAVQSFLYSRRAPSDSGGVNLADNHLCLMSLSEVRK
ncbi:MAG TPA: hypothetical protein VMV84_06495 [Dehalococcoidales bacterium]|nr:hypothetical protein [Dehalococcoidales bacterium]